MQMASAITTWPNMARNRSRYGHHATIARMSRNILAVYSRATAEEMAAGHGWYPTAQRGCVIWSDKYSVNALTIGAVIAALSPQCEWQSNLQAALALVSGLPVPRVGQSRPLQANVRKATAILLDRALSPDAYFIEGWKVKSFSRNLQGDTFAVTVDTHAGQIALNDVTATPRLGGLSAYACFAQAYRKAAAIASIEPSAMQAVTWLTWKRLYPAGRKRAMRRVN